MKHQRKSREHAFTLVEVPVVSRRKRAAFTLVELLVVIGIIALLISILLPALNRARAQANTVKCLANLKSIGQAILIYGNQNKGSYPYGYWDGVGGVVNGIKEYPASPNGTSDWETLLVGTAFGRSQGSTYGDVFNTTDISRNTMLFTCPAALEATGQPKRLLHYSTHPRIMPDLDDGDSWKNNQVPAPSPKALLTPYKFGKLRRSAEIIIVFDGIQNFYGNNGNAAPVAIGMDDDAVYAGTPDSTHQRHYMVDDGTIGWMDQPVYAPNTDFFKGPQGDPVPWANIRWRHGKNDTANYVYGDGHAETRRLKFGKNAEITARNIYVNPN